MRTHALLLLLASALVACKGGGEPAPPESPPPQEPGQQPQPPMQEPTPPPAAPTLAERVDEVLAWLPEESETIVVANGPFRMEPKEQGGDRRDPEAFYKQERISFVEVVRPYVFYLASCSTWRARPSLFPALVSLDFEFALEGSCRFREPRGLGMMRYEGCLVAEVTPACCDALAAAVDAVVASADERIELHGATVAVVRAPLDEDAMVGVVPELFVASPRPGLLLVATDRVYLATLLERATSRPASVAFPPDLPEWNQVDRNAAFFALRHYRHEGVEDDPSSPLRPQAAANVPDPGAIGVVIEVAGADGGKGIARYLTDAEEPLPIARQAWIPSEGPAPRIRLAAPGVVEVLQDVSKPLPASRFLFHALALLGHGIYL